MAPQWLKLLLLLGQVCVVILIDTRSGLRLEVITTQRRLISLGVRMAAVPRETIAKDS